MVSKTRIPYLYFVVYCRKNIWNAIHLIIESMPIIHEQSRHDNTPMNKTISISQYRLRDFESSFKQAV